MPKLTFVFSPARLPDAPPGVKGISLFLVPKYMPGADGEAGERNSVQTVSVEHKLGIHGSPTCVMAYGDADGAIGYLVGEENRGLPYMFTMMNHEMVHVANMDMATEKDFRWRRFFVIAFPTSRIADRPSARCCRP